MFDDDVHGDISNSCGLSHHPQAEHRCKVGAEKPLRHRIRLFLPILDRGTTCLPIKLWRNPLNKEIFKTAEVPLSFYPKFSSQFRGSDAYSRGMDWAWRQNE